MLRVKINTELSDLKKKYILVDVAQIIAINLDSEFKRAEIMDGQLLIECQGFPSENLVGAIQFWVQKLKLNLTISLEGKFIPNALIEDIIFKKYGG